MKKFIYLFATIAVAAVSIVGLFTLTKIEKVNLTTSSGCQFSLDPNYFKNQSLILLREDKILEDLKNKYSCIESMRVEKKLPNTLALSITSKKAVAKIEGTNFALTADGLVIEPKGEDRLPNIFVPQNTKVEIGAKLEDPRALFSLKILSGLLKTDFTVASLRVVDDLDLAVYSASDAVAIFSLEKDPNVQVDSLQAILAKAKIDATKITKIDLRFDKPVISFKE